MTRKLTILLDEQVYERLHAVIGPRRIGRFIESLVRSRLLGEHLDEAYAAMAGDEARAAEALEWAEAMADQIATISKERLSSRVSRLSPPDLRQVEAAIRVQLGLFDTASPAGAGA